jgi:hypothetical protein
MCGRLPSPLRLRGKSTWQGKEGTADAAQLTRAPLVVGRIFEPLVPQCAIATDAPQFAMKYFAGIVKNKTYMLCEHIGGQLNRYKCNRAGMIIVNQIQSSSAMT